MVNDNEHTNAWVPALMSLLTHGILLALFMFFVIKTPIPPYPEGGGKGMEVNLGFSDEGMGDIQPKIYDPNPAPNNEKQQIAIHNNVVKNNNNVITQNYEDAASVKSNTKDTSKLIADKNANQIQLNEPVVNPNALYKESKGGSEGETGKPGDQGNPFGDPNAKNHYGNPGVGNSPGNGGNGTGPGSGPGNGNQYNLGDRKVKIFPKPSYPGNSQGKVVVEIFVDQNGVVVKANAGVKGSTLLSKEYLDVAYNAAMKAKFDTKRDAPEIQRGTITYKFSLQ
jgi:hypothetical protein